MKYIPSIAFEEMSGSAKGVTAAKVKSRKYIRNRGYGGSVRTADQAKVKGVFKRLTTMWRGLTNDQILAWNKLALSQEARSVLGTKGKISGANLFTRLNYWIVACGGSPETTPPTLVGVENPSSATIVCQGDTFTFKLDQALADNGGIFLVIEATEGKSNGVSRSLQPCKVSNLNRPALTEIFLAGAGFCILALHHNFVNAYFMISLGWPRETPSACWERLSMPNSRRKVVSL